MDWSLDPLGYVDYAHGDHVSEGWRKHLLEVFKHDSEVCDSIKSYPDEIFGAVIMNHVENVTAELYKYIFATVRNPGLIWLDVRAI